MAQMRVNPNKRSNKPRQANRKYPVYVPVGSQKKQVPRSQNNRGKKRYYGYKKKGKKNQIKAKNKRGINQTMLRRNIAQPPIMNLQKEVGPGGMSTYLAAPSGSGYSMYSNPESTLEFILPGEEMLCSLTSTSTAFQLATFPVNPGLNSVFRWASAIAAAFEYYMFLDICVDYRPTNTALNAGSVVIAADWNSVITAGNVTAQPPVNKADLTNMKPNISGSAWTKMCWHPSRRMLTTKNNGKLLVRTGAFNGDPNNNDLCVLYIGYQDVPATVGFADVFISYRLKLMMITTPQYPVAGLIKTTGINNITPIAPPFTYGSGTPPYIYGGSNTIFINAEGTYYVVWLYKNTTNTTISMAVSANRSVSVFSQSFFANANPIAGGQVIAGIWNVKYIDPTDPPKLAFTATAANGIVSNIWISSVNQALPALLL